MTVNIKWLICQTLNGGLVVAYYGFAQGTRFLSYRFKVLGGLLPNL